jgi:hypothetical protein
MHGLPNGFDAGFLVGKTLEEISFTANTVYFGFGDGVSVTVLSSLQHLLPSEREGSNVQTVPLSESKLMQIVNHCVVGARGESVGTLVISFDNGHSLFVFDDDPHYETYWIRQNGKEIIV